MPTITDLYERQKSLVQLLEIWEQESGLNQIQALQQLRALLDVGAFPVNRHGGGHRGEPIELVDALLNHFDPTRHQYRQELRQQRAIALTDRLHQYTVKADDFAAYLQRIGVDRFDSWSGLFDAPEDDEQAEAPQAEIDSDAGQGITLKQRCRDFAANVWRHETLTKTDMAKRIHDEIQQSKAYKPKTIGDWVADLNPNRKPGRRPRKTP